MRKISATKEARASRGEMGQHGLELPLTAVLAGQALVQH